LVEDSGDKQRNRRLLAMPKRAKLLAVIIVIVLAAGALFGSGLIQQMLSQSGPTSLSSVTVSGATTGTGSIRSTARTSFTTSGPPAAPPSVFSGNVPPSPTAVGCYRYGQAAWQSGTCLSSEDRLKFGKYPGAFLGINSNAGGGGGSGTLLTYGILMVNFNEYQGETDSQSGSGAYSVQLNTNFFNGNNGHLDWVQFVYQNFCGNTCAGGDNNGISSLCIWNVDVTVARATNNKNGYSTNCSIQGDPGDVGLTGNYEAIIEVWVAANGNLVMYAFINGRGGLLSVVAPDQYGLAPNWVQASGGIMGAGGGSTAQFVTNGGGGGSNYDEEQTDIGVSSCPNAGHLELWQIIPQVPQQPPTVGSCGSQVVASFGPSGVTAESNDLTQTLPTLTNYYAGSHWWLSSVSNTCTSANQNHPPCSRFVNYAHAFGLDQIYPCTSDTCTKTPAMWFTVNAQPTAGTVNAGQGTSTTVNVVSVMGVQLGPITMSVNGMQQGSEDLSGQTCTFSSPLQPGSFCTFTMHITTPQTATPANFNLGITGSPPPNITPGPSVGVLNTAKFNLIIKPALNVPPEPVITAPTPNENFQVNGPVILEGHAKSTDVGNLIGWTPCNQMAWVTSVRTITPVEISSSDFQTNGNCQTTVIFPSPGPQHIVLQAWNSINQKGTTSVDIKITPVSSTFDFDFSVSPTQTRVAQGSSVTFTITVSMKSGSTQTVTLSASGVPPDATPNFNPHSGNPSYTSTLTIQTSTKTPPSSAQTPYTIKISATGGGVTITHTITLEVYTIQ
jgi:hypothetical protein